MNLIKKKIKVVGAAIIDSGKILVAQRPISDKVYKSLKWEFPGGKIEDGEAKEDAIKREIREELDCDIEVDTLLPEIEHEYPDFILTMNICICHLIKASTPKCLEHNAIGWIPINQLSDLEWAAADARCYPQVIDYLKKKSLKILRSANGK